MIFTAIAYSNKPVARVTEGFSASTPTELLSSLLYLHARFGSIGNVKLTMEIAKGGAVDVPMPPMVSPSDIKLLSVEVWQTCIILLKEPSANDLVAFLSHYQISKQRAATLIGVERVTVWRWCRGLNKMRRGYWTLLKTVSVQLMWDKSHPF